MPRVTGVLETCISVADVERSARFYERLFGFQRMASDDRLCAFAVGECGVTDTASPRSQEITGRDVLILFRQGGTTEPVALPGGVIPPHDGGGQSHFALAIPAEDLEAWEKRLTEAGIALESRVRWERGGESLYFRDPDGHLVELATPGIWPIY
jgi:catechol 2,3-dioxygenase-like lactoylglutathione lyase family enzyme